MKLRTALVAVKPMAGARSKFDADTHGDELVFEAGLLTIREKSGRVLVTPAANVLWMEPMVAEAKPAKK